MYKVDAHHHFWTYDPVEYNWITDEMAEIRRDFGPAELKTAMDAAGISSAISVQARQTVQETQTLLKFAEHHEFVRGVVGWVPLIEARVADLIAGLASNRKLRGLRHVLHDEPDPDYMLRDDFNRGVAELKQFGLAYDILIYERHLPQTIQFVDRHPRQVFVLDHFGKPRVAANEISPWRERTRDLAARPNVYCKLSGLVTEADYRNWTEERLKPYFDVAFESFGARRLMFGSDWPVCLVATSYKDWAQIVARFLMELSASEQQRIWSGAAIEAYGL
jgi:L-fuconolactonase